MLDSFNYGMCGRVFRVDSLERTEVSVIASFGGLLMQLKGEMKHLVRIKMDDRVRATGRARPLHAAGARSAPSHPTRPPPPPAGLLAHQKVVRGAPALSQNTSYCSFF